MNAGQTNLTAANTTLLFECIQGKDLHFKVPLQPGQTVTLGPLSTSDISIKELETGADSVVLSYEYNVLRIEAPGNTVPIKINTSPVTAGVVKQGDMVGIGTSLWKAVYPSATVSVNNSNNSNNTNTSNNDSGSNTSATGSNDNSNTGGNTNSNTSNNTTIGNGTSNITNNSNGGGININSFNTTNIRNSFNNLIGLEDLKDFKLRSIFSQVFKKHTPAEMEDQLVTGTIRNTPALTEIEVGWAKPWLFFRLLCLSIILDFVLIMCYHTFPNINLIPGIIFIGSFAVPIATLVFFLEMNVPRNISIFIVMALMFAGGIASLVVTLIFFDRLDFLSRAMGASAAGIIEESGKILCVVLLLRKVKRYKWILNGLLIGAAIGTGFAAFESAGYALNSILQTRSFDQGVDNIVLRGVLAPFCHIIWTGNAAAALWLVKGERNFEWAMLKDMRFVRVFLSSVILHFLWNLGFRLLPLPFVGDLKMVVLGVIGWAITLRLIQAGLKQLNEARRLEVERLALIAPSVS